MYVKYKPGKSTVKKAFPQWLYRICVTTFTSFFFPRYLEIQLSILVILFFKGDHFFEN